MGGFFLSFGMDFFYHSTCLLFLPAIAADGLIPSSEVDGDKVTFFEPDYNSACLYMERNTRMLRFKPIPFRDTDDGECVLDVKVPAAEIEVEDIPGSNKWISLAGTFSGFPKPELSGVVEPEYVQSQSAQIAEHLSKQ